MPDCKLLGYPVNMKIVLLFVKPCCEESIGDSMPLMTEISYSYHYSLQWFIAKVRESNNLSSKIGGGVHGLYFVVSDSNVFILF